MNITLQNISKAFGGNDIFADFSLDIVDGTRLCVCGPNGTGKSTLLRIIAGYEGADAGKVLISKNCRLGYVEQIIDDSVLDMPLITWVQDVLPDWHDFWAEWEAAGQDEQKLTRLMHKQHELEALYGYNPEQQAQTILSGLGFESHKWLMPLKQLSGGWRERAKLARVLVAGADVLLLDEPTNHLDMDAVEWLEDFLISFKGVLIFVAHDRVFMDRIGTHVLYLGASKPIFRKTTFTKFLILQAEIEEQKERDAKKISEDIEHKMDFVRRFGVKATKARQASSRQKMAKKLEKELDKLQPEVKRRELSFKLPKAPPSEKVVVSVEKLGFHFSDGKKLWEDLDFSIFRGDRIALVGHNGSGKSTLLKIIAGFLDKCSGTMSMGSQVKIGYFSQHQSEILNLHNTVLAEMRRLCDSKTTEEELMSVLGLFMLGQKYFERQIQTLSGGERSRLVLAVLFLSRCNFLVLDEPSNHLDLESREALIDALDEFDATILMVAHDRHLLQEVADTIWNIDQNGITVYEEGYADWDSKRKTLKINSKNENNKTSTFSREESNKIKREEANTRNALHKKLKPLQEKYNKLEEKLEQVLKRQSECEFILADPESLQNSDLINNTLIEYHNIKIQADEILHQLEALETEQNIISNTYK